MPLVKYPLQSKKRGYSARELLTKGMKNPDSINAYWVHVIDYKKLIAKDKRLTVAYVTQTRNPGEKPRRHKLRISARDQKYRGLICEAPKVIVTCDCHRHTFKWEYALWNGGAAKLINGNGEPPVITNPRMLIRVCKHLIVGLGHLIKNKL